MSQVELAERIPLSATAIARRIRALEEKGVIEGYQARINRQALGLSMTVIVQIGLKSQNEDLLKSFEEAVASAPSVVSCHLMSGEDDYLVTVMARDLADFERIHKEQLSRLPGVVRLKSSFALRDVDQSGAACLMSVALTQIDGAPKPRQSSSRMRALFGLAPQSRIVSRSKLRRGTAQNARFFPHISAAPR